MDSIVRKPVVPETMPSANMNRTGEFTPRISGTELSAPKTPQEPTVSGKMSIHEMARQFRERFPADPNASDYELVQQILEKFPMYKNVIFSDEEIAALDKMGSDKWIPIFLKDRERDEASNRLMRGADLSGSIAVNAFKEGNFGTAMLEAAKGVASSAGAGTPALALTEAWERVSEPVVSMVGDITGLGTSAKIGRMKRQLEELKNQGLEGTPGYSKLLEEMRSVEPTPAMKFIQPYAQAIGDWYDTLDPQTKTAIIGVYNASNIVDTVLAGASAIQLINGLESMADQAVKQTIKTSARVARKTGKEIAEEITEAAAKRTGVETTEAVAEQAGKEAVEATGEGAVKQGVKAIDEVPPGQVVKGIDVPVGQVEKKAVSAATDVERAAEAIGEGTVSKRTALATALSGVDVGDPGIYAKVAAGEITLETLADDVATAFGKQLEELGETGKGYNVVRAATGKVDLPQAEVVKLLDESGITVKGGKLTETSPLSSNLSSADLAAVQTAYDKIMATSKVTNNQYLNLRQILDEMSNYSPTGTTSGRGRDLIKRMRGTISNIETKIPKLSKLDKEFLEQKIVVKKLRSTYMQKEGNKWVLKPNALSTISNLNKPGRVRVLRELERYVPGASKQIQALQAFAKITKGEQSIFSRFLKNTLMVIGVSSGSIPLVLTSIFASPQGLTAVLKVFALVRKGAAKRVAGIIEKLKGGIVKLTPSDKTFIGKLLSADIKIPKEAVEEVKKLMQPVLAQVGVTQATRATQEIPATNEKK